MQTFGDRRDTFFQKRFGMFIHWGLYAIPAWHEQHQLRLKVPRAEYVKLAQEFNPTAFDPDAWIDLAEAAGMRYLVFTTKHLDGFCMWRTRTTEFNVVQTPFGRDVLAELAAACQRRGMPLGLYYSAIDHHSPFYPNRGNGHELAGPEPGDTPDWQRFCDYMERQIRELCAQYGSLAAFWWDSGPEIGLRAPHHLNPLIRELQPGIVINNRGLSNDGDFSTPEREYDEVARCARVFERPTEACQSVGVESWGYRKGEDYYSLRYLLSELDATLARGGNYLLNVGPRDDGTIPPRAARMLRRIGGWYARTREAFDGAKPCSDMIENPDVLLTRKGRNLYVHLFRPPVSDRVLLRPLNRLPAKATILSNGRKAGFAVERVPRDYHPSDRVCEKPRLSLCHLPVDQFANTVMVVKLEFEDEF